MTYRELIIHVLANGLEDEEVFKDGKLTGFMTVEEAAVKLGIGVAAVHAMMDMKHLSYIEIEKCCLLPIHSNISKQQN